MKTSRRAILLTAVIFIMLLATPVLAAPGDTTRVSVNSSGTQANADAYFPSISGDGRYVTFFSSASNLIAGDTNARSDVFMRDTSTGTTTRVSVDSSGAQANSSSMYSSISADGRYVAFESIASNLVALDTNGYYDIFVHDNTSGTTTRVSIDSGGPQGNANSLIPSISDNGRYVAFYSIASNIVDGDTNGVSDVFLSDTTTGALTRISVDSSGTQGNNSSYAPSISNSGRYVAFYSYASNLVAGDNNGVFDVFVHDILTGINTRVSVDSIGVEGNGISATPSVSGDGRYVAFESEASNLVAGDTNGIRDVFVHDTSTGDTTRVSVNSDGTEGNEASWSPSISSNGRYVTYNSYATNLIPGDTNGVADIFVHDTSTGLTSRVSVDSSGLQENGAARVPSISDDGQHVAFESDASNLVSGDTNEFKDIFVHEINLSAPEVKFNSFSIPSANGANLTLGPDHLVVSFNQSVLADGSQHAANSLLNYLLVRPGENTIFDTGPTSPAICDYDHMPEGDDVRVFLSGATYDADFQTVTLTFDQEFTPLANGKYRLYVCGEASIWSLNGISLNNGSNTAINFSVGPLAGGGSAASTIPATGFPSGKVTYLPRQTDTYSEKDGLFLEIPALGINQSVVGVAQTGASWDVSWLGDNAGWLEGTAFPSWSGNSVLTGHVWNADNTAGIFRQLDTLKWGDRVIIHFAGQQYIYEVRSLEQVKAANVRAMMRHEDQPWLTLVTCKGFNEKTVSYEERVLVRAALIEVK